MKEIKKLKPFFRDLNEDMKSYLRTMRKLKAFQKWLELNIPDNILGTYSFSHDFGEGCPRCFIYLNKDDENSTINLVKWLPNLKKQRWNIEKFWRKNEGYFAYRVQRNYGKYDSVNYTLFFEQTANIDGCVITKKREMQTVYHTTCEKESIIL